MYRYKLCIGSSLGTISHEPILHVGGDDNIILLLQTGSTLQTCNITRILLGSSCDNPV